MAQPMNYPSKCKNRVKVKVLSKKLFFLNKRNFLKKEIGINMKINKKEI
jgi:hypothetical protein